MKLEVTLAPQQQVDINISNFKYSSKNIIVYGLDISNKKMIRKFLKENNIGPDQKFFDIIIDDGSHKLSDMLKCLNTFFKFIKSNGYYIIEDYKFPNYFQHLNDIDHLKIDELISKVKNNIRVNSEILTDLTIKSLLDNKKNINMYKGNLKESDIVFLQKSN